MTKQQWKKAYRALRVHRREVTKAVEDMSLYGTGFVSIPYDNSDTKRIKPSDVMLLPSETIEKARKS